MRMAGGGVCCYIDPNGRQKHEAQCSRAHPYACPGPSAGAARRRAEPVKVPRIGFLPADVPAAISDLMEAFQQGLRDLGYAEGQNIAIVYRFAQGNMNRLPNLAAELVRLKVDITATGTTRDV